MGENEESGGIAVELDTTDFNYSVRTKLFSLQN